MAFYQLPLWVRLAAALTVFNTWVLIAEFMIDRYGIDEYLPFDCSCLYAPRSA